jgi:hypothetical protein
MWGIRVARKRMRRMHVRGEVVGVFGRVGWKWWHGMHHLVSRVLTVSRCRFFFAGFGVIRGVLAVCRIRGVCRGICHFYRGIFTGGILFCCAGCFILWRCIRGHSMWR